MCRSRVVLPAPRKPDRSVMGRRSGGGAAVEGISTRASAAAVASICLRFAAVVSGMGWGCGSDMVEPVVSIVEGIGTEALCRMGFYHKYLGVVANYQNTILTRQKILIS